MAFKLEDSVDVITNELLIFSPATTHTGIQQVLWVDHSPQGQIGEGPIEFTVSGGGSQYIDLKRTRLYVKAKVTQADGADIPENENIAPCNNFLHTLWSQVDIYLQQKLVSTVGTNYPYKAYFDTLLNYGRDCKESQLQAQLFYKDNAGSLDTTERDASPINAGFRKRYELAKKSNVIDMEGPIYSDICQMNRFLINGVEAKFKFWPSKNNFRLMAHAAKEYKVIITEACLKVCKIKVSPGVIAGHAETIQKTPAKYPFIKSEIKVFSIGAGQKNLNLDDIFQGQIPSKVVLAFINEEAYSGSYKKNPYNFEHHNLNYLTVKVDDQSIPAKPLQPKYSEVGGQNYISAFQTLFSGLEIQDLDIGNYLHREDYPLGYAIYVWDLDSDMAKDIDNSFPLFKKGNLKLEAHFEVAPANTVNAIIYATFPNLLEIDEARSAILLK